MAAIRQWADCGAAASGPAVAGRPSPAANSREEQACAPARDGAVKHRVKQLARDISDFEARLAAHARSLGCAGVICGHIHTPAHAETHGVTYCNTGNWVENCTAFVEYGGGVLELIRYFDEDRMPEPPDAAFPRGEFAASDAVLPRLGEFDESEPEAAPAVAR